jgi:uncharacterized protein (DUF1501 family)
MAMLEFHGPKGVPLCDGLSRRDFLKVGTLGAGAVGVSLAELARLQSFGAIHDNDINCILLFLVGGPSQLDTWDPKPDAPDAIRGPFQPIPTNVPGIWLSENFPRMAQMADQYALVRSVHHEAAPIHESGHQLMQTGHLFRGGVEHPHYGSVVSHLKGSRAGLPPFVLLPGPIGNTGVSISHGQTAGYLGPAHEPFLLHDGSADFAVCTDACLDPAGLAGGDVLVNAVDAAQRRFETLAKSDPAGETALSQVFSSRAKQAFDLDAEADGLRERYGRNTFGQSCLLARRLVEHGVRLVTVNMFDTVFNRITWDCHADGGSLASSLPDYQQTLCPMFDRAWTALLEDLKQRGLLGRTLVVAMGEFGRTPQLNSRGGRDHWPGAWTILFAGGGIRGGQVVGASDAHAAEPADRPVRPAEVAATIYHGLGIDLKRVRLPGPEGRPMPLVEAEPIAELFR